MPTLDEIQEQIRALGPLVNTFGTKKEIRYLPEVMEPAEMVLGLTSGLSDGSTWLMVCTPKRVLLLDKGMLYGLRQKEIQIKSISAVEHKTGMLLGEISITVSSQRLKVENVTKQSVKPFVDALNGARNALESGPTTTAAPPAAADDVVSRLERLAALRDRGVLDEAEFATQKANILASA